jgi:hypothetical protein
MPRLDEHNLVPPLWIAEASETTPAGSPIDVERDLIRWSSLLVEAAEGRISAKESWQ